MVNEVKKITLKLIYSLNLLSGPTPKYSPTFICNVKIHFIISMLSLVKLLFEILDRSKIDLSVQEPALVTVTLLDISSFTLDSRHIVVLSEHILKCTIPEKCVKCNVHVTLFWKILNISGSTKFFGL